MYARTTASGVRSSWVTSAMSSARASSICFSSAARASASRWIRPFSTIPASRSAIARPLAPDDAGPEAPTRALADEDRVAVPGGPGPVRACRVPGQPPARALLRISAQRYNEPSDYERLADVLVRRGLAVPAPGRREPMAASGIVAG